jgi:hypothetical protein
MATASQNAGTKTLRNSALKKISSQSRKLGQSAQTLLMRQVFSFAIVGSGQGAEKMDFVERCFAVATITSVIVLVAGVSWLMVH